MATIRHLPKAPITEALIDLRVQAPSDVSVTTLEQAIENSEPFGYYKKSPIIRSSFGFSVNPEENPIARATSGPTTIIGVRLHSEDEKYVAQFSIEGFTLSRLRPYESWAKLIEETQRLWSIYCQWIRPDRISRVATRFINNLQLPLKQGENFEEFVTLLPTFPKEIPQELAGFLQRYVSQDPQSGATIISTHFLERFISGQTVPLILDIDVFKESILPTDSAEVWIRLDQFRELKNRFFFSFLTEKAVELYL
ncbi:MAG: TIGR04255 family protein [Gammaproteobacteria bacterium]